MRKRSSKRKILSSLGEAKEKANTAKVASRLKRVANLAGFRLFRLRVSGERELSASEIDRLVKSELKKRGMEDIPDLDYGDIIKGTVRNLQHKGPKWSDSIFEEVLSGVVETMALSYNPETNNELRGIYEEIQKWRDQGKTESDMKTLLGSMAADKAKGFYKRITKVRDDPYSRGEHYDSGEAAEPIKQENRQEELDEKASEVFEGMLMPDASGTDAKQWLNLVERNPELQDMLKEIDREMRKRLTRTDTQLVWDAAIKNAGSTNFSDIKDHPVTFRSPKTNRKRTRPLIEALEHLDEYADERISVNVYNLMNNKIRPKLKKLWEEKFPDVSVEEYLRE